jgi:hypothetical protein
VDDQGLTVGASAQADPLLRRRAVRALASMSRDAADCVFLLDVLGLKFAEGVGDLPEEIK